MARDIILYSRATSCSDIDHVRARLQEWNLPFREIDIEADARAAARLEAWTGFLSVPTVVIADAGSDEPYQEPAGLTPNMNPRNVDRGSIITEPSTANLRVFLEHNGFVKVDLYRLGSFLRG